MKRVAAYIIILPCVWFASIQLDRAVEKRAPLLVSGPEGYSVTFKGPAMKVISMGYDNAMADYLFMKMIQYFAHQSDNHQPMPNLISMANVLTDLDPRFTYAYEFAWTAATNFDRPSTEAKLKAAGDLLRKGWRYNGDSWRIAQNLGFHDFYYEASFDEAANMYEAAYRLKPSFPLYLMLATRLRSQAGKPELALAALQQQLNETSDPQMKGAIENQISIVKGEITARLLDSQVQKFNTDTGRFPDSLDQLVTAGYIDRIPQDGMGGAYKWNPKTKEVESTTFGRLKPHYDPNYLPPWKTLDSGQPGQ